jgi:hypothetical protein
VTVFARLSVDWNAEPNAPHPTVRVEGSTLRLAFAVNPFVFPFEQGARAEITFADCWRYRLGSPNDEGWYAGQCRFGRTASTWGEFYELTGELHADRVADWKILRPEPRGSRHFLFYLRDDTFECDAADWRIALPPRIGRPG